MSSHSDFVWPKFSVADAQQFYEIKEGSSALNVTTTHVTLQEKYSLASRGVKHQWVHVCPIFD